jgi:xylulokinase
MTRTWLAFDIGTTGTKAALVSGEGIVLRSVSYDYPTHTGTGGVVEQDAADWWAAVLHACHELDAGDEAEAIALTGQMQDTILVRADGETTRPVILYSDTRARAEADHIVQVLGAERLRELTGNDQDAGSLLAKLVWLKTYEPASMAKSTWLLLGAADYIAFRMTGIAATDTTTASTTGLMSLNNREALDKAVLDEIGIGDSSRLLPPFLPGGTRVAELTQGAATALDLRPGLPVHSGPGDAGATTLGVGSGEIGAAYAYLGTSGWIAFTAAHRALPGRGVITLAHPDSALYIQVAPLLTAGGNLEWVRNLFDTDDYDSLISRALATPPTNLVYLPYLRGERSPFSDPLARGAFVGLDMGSSKCDLYRAVLEGVVFAYRHALDALVPDSIKSLVLTGGGARSRQWGQLFSDILGVPVAVSPDGGNVGVRGAILAAQVVNGEQPSYAPKGLFPSDVALKPETQHSSHYNKQYALFRDLYPALKDAFGKMA